MKFTPLTEEELQVASLLEEGIYHYQVIQAEDKISAKGNEYLSLILKVWDKEGREHNVFTNLALVKLLKHFCDVNNMQENYNAGDVPASICLDKSGGMVVIGIEGEKPDGKGGMYKAKNVVKDYVPCAIASSLQPLKRESDFVDSELPF